MTLAAWLLLTLGVALVVAIVVTLRTNPTQAPAPKPPKYAPRHKVAPARDPHDLPLVADVDDAPGTTTETDQ